VTKPGKRLRFCPGVLHDMATDTTDEPDFPTGTPQMRLHG